jgi:hypothetical protein
MRSIAMCIPVLQGQADVRHDTLRPSSSTAEAFKERNVDMVLVMTRRQGVVGV